MADPKPKTMDPRLTTLPEGLEYAHFTNGDGATIRYASAPPVKSAMVDGKPTGVVVLVTGFRESTERYYERIKEHQARGEVVYTMDWRGQGGSQRYHADMPQRPGAQGYEHDCADLDQFVTQIAKIDEKHPGVTKTLYAHSMGGNIAMRYLHDYPGRFDNAVITSPMLGINTGRFPKWFARAAARMIKAAGAHHYLPGEGDWSEEKRLNQVKKPLLNMRTMRQSLQDHFYRHFPDLRMGGATAGWFVAATKSTRVLRNPKYLAAIKTPMMLVAGALDDTVDPSAITRAARHLPNATLHYYSRVGHSPWMESDRTRADLWSKVDDFLAGRTPQAAHDNTPPAKRLASGPETVATPAAKADQPSLTGPKPVPRTPGRAP